MRAVAGAAASASEPSVSDPALSARRCLLGLSFFGNSVVNNHNIDFSALTLRDPLWRLGLSVNWPGRMDNLLSCPYG